MAFLAPLVPTNSSTQSGGKEYDLHAKQSRKFMATKTERNDGHEYPFTLAIVYNRPSKATGPKPSIPSRASSLSPRRNKHEITQRRNAVETSLDGWLSGAEGTETENNFINHLAGRSSTIAVAQAPRRGRITRNETPAPSTQAAQAPRCGRIARNKDPGYDARLFVKSSRSLSPRWKESNISKKQNSFEESSQWLSGAKGCGNIKEEDSSINDEDNDGTRSDRMVPCDHEPPTQAAQSPQREKMARNEPPGYGAGPTKAANPKLSFLTKAASSRWNQPNIPKKPNAFEESFQWLSGAKVYGNIDEDVNDEDNDQIHLNDRAHSDRTVPCDHENNNILKKLQMILPSTKSAQTAQSPQRGRITLNEPPGDACPTMAPSPKLASPTKATSSRSLFPSRWNQPNIPKKQNAFEESFRWLSGAKAYDNFDGFSTDDEDNDQTHLDDTVPCDHEPTTQAAQRGRIPPKVTVDKAFESRPSDDTGNEDGQDSFLEDKKDSLHTTRSVPTTQRVRSRGRGQTIVKDPLQSRSEHSRSPRRGQTIVKDPLRSRSEHSRRTQRSFSPKRRRCRSNNRCTPQVDGQIPRSSSEGSFEVAMVKEKSLKFEIVF